MRDRNAVIAGAFILVAIGLIVAVIVAVNGLATFTQNFRTYDVSFDVGDDIGGLIGGSEVRVGGLKMGNVDNVIFVEDGPLAGRIAARFELPERIVLGEGAVVAVQSTITGSSWLNVSDLGDISQPLPDNAVIVGRPNTLTQLINSINQMAPEVTGTIRDVRETTLPRVNQVADNFANLAKRVEGEVEATALPIRTAADDVSVLTGNLREKLPPIIDDAGRLTAAGADVATDLQTALGSDDGEGEGAPNLAATLANIKASSDRLPALFDQLDQAMTSVNGRLDQAKSALQNVEQAAERADGLLADNRPRISRIITNVREASETFKLATNEIRRSPWRLLYQPDKSQSEQLDLYDTARRFAEGAQELSAAADALRAAADDETVRPERVEELLRLVEARFTEFSEAEQNLYDKLRE
jgi:ABC-type transporter Mla subunit MlaD